MEAFKLFEQKAREDYENGNRVTIDDCINVTMESMRLHKKAFKHARNAKFKRYFNNALNIDKLELKSLMEIKKNLI